MYRDVLPPFLTESMLYQGVLDAWEVENEKCGRTLDDFLLQCIPFKATWSLPYWETILGITNTKNLSDVARREVVISRLRGAGTASKSLIESMAAAFSGGEVTIIERPETHSFIVKFIGALGIPANLEGLTQAINRVKPAHMLFSYEYSYMTWDQHDGYAMTWDEWDALALTFDEFEAYKE